MVNKPAIYPRSSRSRVVSAFALAASLHVAAAIASRHDNVASAIPIGGPSDVIVVDIVDSLAAIPLPEVSAVSSPAVQDSEFTEDDEKIPVPRVTSRILPVRDPPVRSSAPVSLANMRATAWCALRPGYPYECRRAHITGNGVALMTIAPDGSVTDAQMTQSTGNPALDQATLSALRRWRFKPGLYSAVRAPITFSLTGVQL